MTPPIQYSTWTVISSLRDLDRWLVYSVCSGCLTRWALGYTCRSAVFDFGKGREAPQHARRSLWRFEDSWRRMAVKWTLERLWIRSSSVYRALSMYGESRPILRHCRQQFCMYGESRPILRHCRQQFCHYLDFASSPIILTSLRHQYIPNSPE